MLKRRMNISVKFRLRAGQTTGAKMRELKIRLTVNGETATDFGSGETVKPTLWNHTLQTVTGRSLEAENTNEALSRIRVRLREILNEFKAEFKAGKRPEPPTADEVKVQWLREQRIKPAPVEDSQPPETLTVLGLFKRHLDYMHSLNGSDNAYQPKTLEIRKTNYNNLKAYLTHIGKPAMLPGEINRGWAKNYFNWLLKRPMKSHWAVRNITHLRAALDHFVEEEVLTDNPLGNYKVPRLPGKAVYFLEEDQLLKLWNIRWLGSRSVGLDWFRLMCYTGMDLPDLVRYVANPKVYETKTEDGVIIEIDRLKTQRTAGAECFIPKQLEVDVILSRYPGGLPYRSNTQINRVCIYIQKELDFPSRLTTKIARKTAGAHFLMQGYRLEAVSRILGHSSVKTTEKHYVKILPSLVKSEMNRLNSLRKDVEWYNRRKPTNDEKQSAG